MIDQENLPVSQEEIAFRLTELESTISSANDATAEPSHTGSGPNNSSTNMSAVGGSGGGNFSMISEIYNEDYMVTQINGCRQYGPPRNWKGMAPGFGCEIYVKRIPPEFTELELVPLFQQFGRLYELRLMMDYNNQNRRYCFVRFTNEEDAKTAIEVLNHHYVKDNQTLEVQKSFEKCRLFVGNLPKDLDRKTIEVSFRSLFPEMTRFVMHNRIADGEKNRGFAFMDFPDHAAALRAKKQTTPGCMRMWDRDIKIVWANPQRSLDHSGVDEVKTLFVRNIDLTVNTKDLYSLFSRLVPRQHIIKVSRVREFCFVEFATREQADLVMHTIQGYVLNKFPLDIEWAMPPLRNSFHNMKNYDFDSLLRIKCIANGWDLPIILYGRVFALSQLQYAAVVIRNCSRVHAYFIEISLHGLADVQSRLCEAISILIDEAGVLPEPNLVLKITNDHMIHVGSVQSLAQPLLNVARDADLSINLFWNEIFDLCVAVNVLVKYTFDELYTMYRQELETGEPFSYLQSLELNDRILGCLNQNFRRRPALNKKLDNREILFVLCDQYTLTNYNFTKKSNFIDVTLGMMEQVGTSPFPYKIMPMFPLQYVQSPGGREIKIGAVYFGLNPYSNTQVPGEVALCMVPQNQFQNFQPIIPPQQQHQQFAVARAPIQSNYCIPPPPNHLPPQIFAANYPSTATVHGQGMQPSYFGEAQLMAQAMQQLRIPGTPMPQTFFGHPESMRGGGSQAPPGALMPPPYFY
ncbi:uncharacterized protein LOC129738558 isoform X2 [Uranotaenia lowii]|uniref:uncharacterized protein LOC129738558 isoform X2 n=1 Tax=Uranotaenia lowii TaxID=190385 RepID=UPI00247B0986|nr:uncharacterized protein LOC129738558 isoform X2 [Uranotaenia lowii]